MTQDHHGRIAELGRQVLAGEDLTPEQGRWLFHLESRPDIFELLAWANRIREQFKGNKIHLCSIVNIKAEGAPRIAGSAPNPRLTRPLRRATV